MRRRHADLNVFRREALDFGQQPVAEPFEECRTAAEDDVGIEDLPKIQIGLLNGEGEHLVNAFALVADQVGAEEDFRRAEPGRAHFDRRSVRQSVFRLLRLNRFFLLRVDGQVTSLFFDRLYHLQFGRSVEVVAFFAEQEPEVSGKGGEENVFTGNQ